MDSYIVLISIFVLLSGALFLADFGIIGSFSRDTGFKNSLRLSIIYFIIPCLFSILIYKYLGLGAVDEYLTGFVIEKTLSFDNIFVIIMICTYFKIPLENQTKILFWGILGVLVLRVVLLLIGSALIEKFSWVIYIFGILLIFTGVKMFIVQDSGIDIENSIVVKLINRFFKVYHIKEGEKITCFTKTINNQFHITSNLLCLCMIIFADIMFAIDSIPAIYSISNDKFIIYSTNIFSILGLRPLYYVILSMIEKFRYLKYSLAAILIYIGAKIIISPIYKISPIISLIVTILLLSCGMLYKGKKINKSA